MFPGKTHFSMTGQGKFSNKQNASLANNTNRGTGLPFPIFIAGIIDV